MIPIDLACCIDLSMFSFYAIAVEEVKKIVLWTQQSSLMCTYQILKLAKIINLTVKTPRNAVTYVKYY